MLSLAIETSCDDCAAAVLRGPQVVAAVRFHQDRLHRRHGGVVPEVASREHVRQIEPTVQGVLARAGVSLGEIRALAVTQGPGLIGSLLVGLRYAQGLAVSAGLPLVGVHHLMAHLFSPLMGEADLTPFFPALGLVVSGGHTALYSVRSLGEISLLGETLDDAAGEAMDKTAKLLGLGFPGGAALSELAKTGDPKACPLPLPMQGRDTLLFSFSGLKTAAARKIEQIENPVTPQHLAAAFEARVVQHLAQRTEKALLQTGHKTLLVGGGVACNGPLRHALAQVCQQNGVVLHLAKPRFCTDNAAMGGFLAHHLRAQGRAGDFPLEPRARWPVGGP